MKTKKLIFNGVSSLDMGVVIQTPPTYEFPDRDVTVSHVPGRNGDIVVDNKCYKNVNRTYNIAKGFFTVPHLVANAQELISWLAEPRGKYVRLEDDYDPDVYRLASFVNAGSFSDLFDKAYAINVTFNCKPQRFLKSGEEEQTFTGNNVNIENPSHYEALPLIGLENMPVQGDSVLIMSVKNQNGDITSSVTIKQPDANVLYIDSDKQNCYDNTGKDANEKIGLNGKSFPTLDGGITNIQVAQYKEVAGDVQPYLTEVVNEAQEKVTSAYKDYETLENAAQDKRYVRSYTSLIDAQEDYYEAPSYQAYVNSLCKEGYYDEEGNLIADEYEFDSFNNILNQYCRQYTFAGPYNNLGQFPYPQPRWFNVYDTGDGNIRLESNQAGFYITSKDNTIRFVGTDEDIITFKQTETITVTYYEAENVGGQWNFKVGYNDMPEWLDFHVEYDVNDHSPISIQYRTNSIGYYWTDKTWIFGKSKWEKNTSASYHKILNELTWNKSKKAFVNSQGLATSTTSKFAYKYLAKIIDYPSDDENPVHFSVNEIGTDLTSVEIVASDVGYYKFTASNDKTKQIWYESGPNGQIRGNLSTTASFEVEYLEDIPDYSEEENWPEWLDPKPVNVGGGDILLNTDKINFTVNETALYRITISKESSNDTYTEWTTNNAYDELQITDPGKSTTTKHQLLNDVDNAFYICKIDEKPTEFPNDRAYGIYDKETQEVVDVDTPPTWLSVTYEINNRIEKNIRDDIYEAIAGIPDMTLSEFLKDPENVKKYNVTLDDIDVVYKSIGKGFYKWDNNSSWFLKEDDKDLLVTGYKDTTVFYYMPGDTLPAYENYPMDDVVTVEPQTDYVGNPTELNFYARVSGYFRFNSESDWKYYEAEQLMYIASTSAVTTVYHLKDYEGSDLSNLNIYITPHWWML